MELLYQVLRALQLALLVFLGLAAIVHHLRRGGAASAWLAATFGTLATVAVMARLLPDVSDAAWVGWIRKLEFVLLALFPYLLYRFQASIVPPRRWMWWTAHALTAVVVIWTLLLPTPSLGASDVPDLYVYALLLQWVVLSLRVAYRLWRAGSDQPRVARTRMRTLALGSLGLVLALVLAGTAPEGDDPGAIDIVVQLAAIVSAPLFLLGFAPPAFVRRMWRRRDEQALRAAELRLMEALTPEAVAAILLPPVADLLGGRGAAMIDEDGGVVAAIGLTSEEMEQARGYVREGRATSPFLTVPLNPGWLAVRATNYMPFFGPDESEMLRSFGVVAGLALQRAKHYEREQQARERLIEAQQIARMASWEWDLRNDLVTWSEGLFGLFGLDPARFDPSYDGYLQLVHPDDRGRLSAELERAIQAKSGFELDHRVVRPDGTIMHNHARGKVVLDDEGNVVKLVGTAQDITERKQGEAVREQQAQLLDLASDAIVVRSLDAVIRFWNQGAERLYGWSAEEAFGKRSHELLRTRFPRRLEDIVDELQRDGRWEGELEHRRRDGEKVFVWSRWTVTRDHTGGIESVLEINTDITQRKSQEVLRDHFIANAAHELRTPLTTLIGFIHVATERRKQLSPQRLETVFDALARSGERLQTLVENLLDLTRLQQGTVRVTLQPVRVANASLRVLETAPPPAGRSVDVRVADDLVALADPGRLDQILSNLLINAYRYGGANVRLEAHGDDGQVVIAVSDDGPGVEEKLVPNLFDPFTRGTAASNAGGSGLGLAIVKMLAEACGGTVEYRRDERGGARFQVYLASAS